MTESEIIDPLPLFTAAERNRKSETPKPKHDTGNKVDRLKREGFLTKTFKGSEDNLKNDCLTTGIMPGHYYTNNLQGKHKQYMERAKAEYIKNGFEAARETLSNIPELAKGLSEHNKIIQLWKLSANSFLVSDFAASVLKVLTTKEKYFERFYPLNAEDFYTKKQTLAKYVIEATPDQVKKCAFGLCVNERGEFIRGTAEILKKQRMIKEFTDLLMGDAGGKSTGREPQLIYFDEDNPTEELGFYKPVIFEGYNRQTNTFKILLDPRFFKIRFDNIKNRFVSAERFIPTIAGLASVVTIGHALNESKERKPNVTTALMFLHALQAAFNMQRLFGIKRIDGLSDRKKTKIILRRDAIANYFPSCYDKARKVVRYTTAIKQAGFASDYLLAGLKKTSGLLKLLEDNASDNILLPSIEKTLYFDDDISENAVFVNCENPKSILDNRHLHLLTR